MISVVVVVWSLDVRKGEIVSVMIMNSGKLILEGGMMPQERQIELATHYINHITGISIHEYYSLLFI